MTPEPNVLVTLAARENKKSVYFSYKCCVLCPQKKWQILLLLYLEEPYVQSLTTFCPWNFVIFIKNFYFLIIWHKRSSISIQLLDIDICVTLFHCNSTLCYKVFVVVFFFLWVINKSSSQQCNIRYHQNWKTLLKTYV